MATKGSPVFTSSLPARRVAPLYSPVS